MAPPKKQPPFRPTRDLSLDAREVRIVEQLDPQVQKTWQLQRSLRQSLLGYAILDLCRFEEKLVFGTWNSRPLKPVHVQRLLASFQQNGLERFDEKSVIPLVMDRGIVDPSSLTNDPSPADTSKLPQLQFSVLEDSVASIKCAGGRHRFEALKLYLKDLEQANANLQDKRTVLEETEDTSLSRQDAQFYNNDSVKELQRIGGILASGGKWLVAVYDETSLLSDGIELVQHLSRNETRHVYMETDEEKVIMEIQLLATLPDEKRAQRLKELRNLKTSAKKANPLVTVVNMESPFKATELLVNCSSYFLEMPEMTVKWLFNELCGIHGGLMCAAITAMARRLDLCFTDTVLDLEDVEQLLAASADDIAPAIKHRMSQLRQAKKVEGLRRLLSPLLCIIDEAWRDAMQVPAADAIGCTSDDEYITVFEQYVQEATVTLSQHIHESDLRSQISPTLHPILNSIPAKFKLVSLDRTSNTYGLPVLTRSPLVLLANHFKRIPLALQEVSRWLDPLVDYQLSFSKSSNSPYTQIAIDAIKCIRHLSKDCPADELLLSVILNDYGACLALEVALPTLIASHTQRVQTSKELTQLLPSRSNKDRDFGEVDNEAIKKPRARMKQSSSEQDAQLSKLRKECDTLARAMYMACKPQNPIPLKNKNNLGIQGAYLLLASAWRWTRISSSSRSREFHLIAGAAVLEFNIIAEYRGELLESTPSSAVLRSSLATQLQQHTKKPSPYLTKSKTSTGSKPDSPFVFADQIATPLVEETFSISDTLPSWASYQDRGVDQRSIQKIVHAVEKCSLAWQDPYSTESKSPALNNNIHDALQRLVKEVEKNAYHKRSGTLGGEMDEEDMNLGITFRGSDAKTLLPTGQRGKNRIVRKKMLPQISDKVPIVPNSSESPEEAKDSSEEAEDGGEETGDSGEKAEGKDEEVEGSDEGEGGSKEAKDGNHQGEEVTSLSTPTQAAKMLCPPAQMSSANPSVTPSHVPRTTSDSERHRAFGFHFPESPSVPTASPSVRCSGRSRVNSAANDSRQKRPRSSDGTGSGRQKRVKGAKGFLQS